MRRASLVVAAVAAGCASEPASDDARRAGVAEVRSASCVGLRCQSWSSSGSTWATRSRSSAADQPRMIEALRAQLDAGKASSRSLQAAFSRSTSPVDL